jgi:hypothetical protein
MRLWRKILDAKSALNAVSDELNASDLGSIDELSFYIVFGAGTSAGAVQIESAHLTGYTGTWAAEGSAVAWVAATRVHKVSIAGTSFITRARISTGIVGGTVDVWVKAAG